MVFTVPSKILKKIENYKGRRAQKAEWYGQIEADNFNLTSSSSEISCFNHDFNGITVEKVSSSTFSKQTFFSTKDKRPAFLWLNYEWVPCSILSSDGHYMKIQNNHEKWMWVSHNLISEEKRPDLEGPDLEGQPWSLYRVGESVRIYEARSRVWQRGDVQAIGASGSVWVRVQEEGASESKTSVKERRSDSWEIYRDIDDVKMVIHVKVVKANEKVQKLRFTFDIWTTSFGMIRNRLAHEYKIKRNALKIRHSEEDSKTNSDNIQRNAFKIRHNEEYFKNNTENNNRPAMWIPIVYGDGCWLEMEICSREAQNLRSFKRSTVDFITHKAAPKEKTPFSLSGVYENSSAFSDESSDNEVGPKEESYDSEEFSMI